MQGMPVDLFVCLLVRCIKRSDGGATHWGPEGTPLNLIPPRPLLSARQLWAAVKSFGFAVRSVPVAERYATAERAAGPQLRAVLPHFDCRRRPLPLDSSAHGFSRALRRLLLPRHAAPEAGGRPLCAARRTLGSTRGSCSEDGEAMGEVMGEAAVHALLQRLVSDGHLAPPVEGAGAVVPCSS